MTSQNRQHLTDSMYLGAGIAASHNRDIRKIGIVSSTARGARNNVEHEYNGCQQFKVVVASAQAVVFKMGEYTVVVQHGDSTYVST